MWTNVVRSKCANQTQFVSVSSRPAQPARTDWLFSSRRPTRINWLSLLNRRFPEEEDTMSAQSNASAPFSYTWGIADNIRTESVVEFSPNVNYTVTDGSVSTTRAIMLDDTSLKWMIWFGGENNILGINHQVVALLSVSYCDRMPLWLCGIADYREFLVRMMLIVVIAVTRIICTAILIPIHAIHPLNDLFWLRRENNSVVVDWWCGKESMDVLGFAGTTLFAPPRWLGERRRTSVCCCLHV